MDVKQIFVGMVGNWEFADMVDAMAEKANAVTLYDFDPSQNIAENAEAVAFAATNNLYAMEWGYFIAVGDQFEDALKKDDIAYTVNDDPTVDCWWATSRNRDR
jgi:hypothetical protein